MGYIRAKHSTGKKKLTVNNWLQSSQLAEPLWTDPGLKSGIGVRELISIKIYFKKIKAQAEYWRMNRRSFP